ncbi:MAG: DUF5020 family protein [Porphyromonas sp.]|nr:DUF5020 family protein [Porphyromonas sp.]
MKNRIVVAAVVAILSGFGLANAQTQVEYHHIVGKYFYGELKDAKFPANLLTIQHKSGDKWGENFLFVDMNMGDGHLQNAYTEIHRDTKFWEAPIYIHTQYNGGLARERQYDFNQAYLGGIAWKYRNPEKQAYVGVSMSYRYDRGLGKPHNMELYTTWSWTSWNRIFTLSGRGALTTQNLPEVTSGVRLLYEPQFWVNLNQFVGVHDDFNLSLGTEVKLSYSTVAPDQFYALPTVGIKWTFK